MTRLARIEHAIARETDRKKVALLNLAWWAETFRLERERDAAVFKPRITRSTYEPAQRTA